MRIRYELWLHFQRIGSMFQMVMTSNDGGPVAMPVPCGASTQELAAKLTHAGWPERGVKSVLDQIAESGSAHTGAIQMTQGQCALLGLNPKPDQVVWDMAEVEMWIKELEGCPTGGIADSLAKDINFVVNNCRQSGKWTEVCKRGQVALVEYQKRRQNP